MVDWPHLVNDPDDYLHGLMLGEIPEDHLMQFTGLLDKNGKEIYEGDIIVKIINGERRYPSSIERKMTNNCGECGWVYGWDMPDHAETIAQEYEVIGNIHENPELLK